MSLAISPISHASATAALRPLPASSFIRDAYERIFAGVLAYDVPKAWEGIVAHHMLYRGYEESQIIAVLDHCNRYGTAECAPHLSSADRALIEKQLPDAGNWTHPAYAGTWEPNTPLP